MTKAIKKTIVTILLLCTALVFACFSACDLWNLSGNSTNSSQSEQTENNGSNNSDNSQNNGSTEHICFFVLEQTEEKYLKSAATCTGKVVYYYSCSCGEKGTETFEYGKALGHNFVWRSNGNGTHTGTCKRDNCSYFETKDCHGGTATCTEQATCKGCNAKYGELKSHIFNQKNIDEKYLKSSATCTSKAVYYKSCSCGKSSETETFETGVFASHKYVNKQCEMCGKKQPSEGLSFELNYNKTGYDIIGLETCIDTDLIIPDTYNNLPVRSIKSYAFENCSSLTSIEISNSVMSIGEYAFEGCNSLENIYYNGDINDWVQIDFGNGYSNPVYYAKSLYMNNALVTEANITTATKISSFAFFNNINLSKVVIGENVKTIGKSAFYGCNTLTSIEIPNNVTSIGAFAFSGCSSLEEMIIPFVGANKTATGYQSVFGYIFGYTNNSSSNAVDGATYQYSNSKSSSSYAYYHYYIPASIKSVTIIGGDIPYYAFYNCSTIESVTIGNSVTRIGNYAFYNCTALTEINYNATECADLSSYNYVFYNAGKDGTGIKVTIGKNVKKIPSYLFNPYNYSYLPKITEVVFEEGSVCESVGSSAFGSCGLLTSIEIPNSVTSIGSYAFNCCNSLTSVTIGNSVTSIGKYAFCECGLLTSVTIGEGVTSIGGHAFEYCSSLTSIEIPDGVTSIGNYAFGSCGLLTSIEIPNSVTSIGAFAFECCSSLTSIEMPDGVTSIEANLFCRCSSLTSIILPNSVTNIGWGAFDYCISLTSIEIPNSVTSIGGSAFRNCSSLRSITIEENVTSIGSSAFCNCSSLKSIEIPDSVTSIGNSAFYNCSSLTSIDISNSVTSIGRSAFACCTLLTSINIADNNVNYKSIDGNLYSKDGTTLIQYAIGKVATEFIIPNNVTTIGDDAFRRCNSLKSVTISKSVTSIENAFCGCSSLTSVTFCDTSNWYITSSRSNYENKSGGKSLSITNSSSVLSVFIEESSSYCYKI